MFPNFIFAAVAALIPLIMGYIYYHPKVFGTKWMNFCGLTEEKLEKDNIAVIFGASYVLSFVFRLFVHLSGSSNRFVFYFNR
ncbi:DUF1761 domain-containing protein [Patiriisocius sp. Uisw_017]|uniref:DUF1761 domain-containing protein n=1 Tax=Patiriisocius sp. Uisw_017 TaxID=3230968 RepID=UPI0039EB39E1